MKRNIALILALLLRLRNVVSLADLYNDADLVVKLLKKNPAYLKACERHV